jgi:hypothetical protein
MVELAFSALAARARSPWPSVRLACCHLIADGLDAGGESFVSAYLQWVKNAQHEAATVDRLAPLLLCARPMQSAIVSQVPTIMKFPSVLSDQVDDALGMSLPDSSDVEIESPPASYGMSEFFAKNMTGFVPVLFQMVGRTIERRHLWAFSRHWGFHWEDIMTRNEIGRTTEPLHYLNSGLGRRFPTLESDISEAYFASFLRTLTELHRRNVVPDSLVVQSALEVFPFAPLLEAGSSQPAPPKWTEVPLPEAPSQGREQPVRLPEIDAWLERFWARREKPWVLGSLVATGRTSFSTFTIEVRACLQTDSDDPSDPDLAELWEATGDVQETPRPLALSSHDYGGDVAEFVSGRWSVIPLVADVRVWAGRRWQNARRAWGLPGPYSVFLDGDDRVQLERGPPVSFWLAGRVIGLFKDWITDWTDEVEAGSTPPAGSVLFLKREDVQRVTESYQMRYVWLYHVSHFVRSDRTEDHEVLGYHGALGASELVIP